MVIFKHHAGNLDTVIYGNAVVYKDQVADIDNLDYLKLIPHNKNLRSWKQSNLTN